MNHLWTYNGAEYPFDISESESMGRMCCGLNTLRKEIGSLPETGASDALRSQCLIIRRFFDTVLGDGCGVNVCGADYSADAHTTAYVEFISFVNTQVNSFREKMAALEEKYCDRAEQLEQVYGV